MALSKACDYLVSNEVAEEFSASFSFFLGSLLAQFLDALVSTCPPWLLLLLFLDPRIRNA